MDLRTLRYCQAIARLGSITRAAEELHIAQPALSIAIKKLEDELGHVLFVRQHNRRVTPTAEGQLLLNRAERLLQEVDSARRELADAADLRTGVVKIGMPPMYGLEFFPPLMTAFHSAHPGIVINAIEGSAGEVGRMLDDGVIDLAILESRRVRPNWRHERLGSGEMVICVHTDHPLAKRTSVSTRDLDGLPMVVFDETFIQRNVLDKRCQRSKVRYRIVMESNYVPLVIEAAAAGMGAATLMRLLAEAQQGLVPLSLAPPELFQFNLCWLDERYLSKANQAFVTFALQRSRNANESRNRTTTTTKKA